MSVAFGQQKAKITIECIDNAEIKAEKGKLKEKKTTLKTQEESRRLKLNEQNVNEEKLASEPNILPVGCVGEAIVTVFPGSGAPSNTTVDYTITQSGSQNTVGLKRFPQNQYTSSIVMPVSLDSTGYGVSAPFYIKGLTIGETTLSGESAYNETTLLDLIVVECKCPVIPANTPPRN